MPFALFIFTLTLQLPTPTSAQQAPKPKPLPAEMPVFLDAIKNLQPYMVSEGAFSSSKNEKKIQLELDRLRKASMNLQHEDRISEPLLKQAAINIENHFADLTDSFKISKSYSRYMLNSALDGCSSCHSQVTAASKRPLLYFEPKDLAGSDFQKAEFLFAVRHFPEAIKKYEAVIAAKKSPHRMSAYLRGLTIYLLHYRDIAKAEEWTKAYPAKKKFEKATMKSYLAALRKLKSEKIPVAEGASVSEITAFAKKSVEGFGPEDFPKKLFTSGILHSFVLAQNTAGKTTNAAIYYYLGMTDMALNSNFLFSLVDDSFRRCVELTPKTKQAEDCFEELESHVEESFSGSSGAHIPKDVEDMLNKYAELAGLEPKTYPR